MIQELIEFPPLYPRGDGTYTLVKDFSYEWLHGDDWNRITVPRGFRCDLSSSPRVVWSFISPFDLGPAAILHDFIYSHGGRLPVGAHEQVFLSRYFIVTSPWTRRDADRLFARVMRESGVPRWRRRLAYLAVRLFGWKDWKEAGGEEGECEKDEGGGR